MGAPLGNTNAGKTKPWADALKRALARRAAGDFANGLNDIADRVVEAAIEGNKDAWQEIGNRLDGKPAQTISGDPDAPPVMVILASSDAGL